MSITTKRTSSQVRLTSSCRAGSSPEYGDLASYCLWLHCLSSVMRRSESSSQGLQQAVNTKEQILVSSLRTIRLRDNARKRQREGDKIFRWTTSLTAPPAAEAFETRDFQIFSKQECGNKSTYPLSDLNLLLSWFLFCLQPPI